MVHGNEKSSCRIQKIEEEYDIQELSHPYIHLAFNIPLIVNSPELRNRSHLLFLCSLCFASFFVLSYVLSFPMPRPLQCFILSYVLSFPMFCIFLLFVFSYGLSFYKNCPFLCSTLSDYWAKLRIIFLKSCVLFVWFLSCFVVNFVLIHANQQMNHHLCMLYAVAVVFPCFELFVLCHNVMRVEACVFETYFLVE